MKLTIQIPCWNEEKTISEMIDSLPKKIPGVETIEVNVIDDGSSDSTVQNAKEAGATRVIELNSHRGLAKAFTAGIETALETGADILVNTDADMQYPSKYIKDIIKPIITQQADIVIGNRLDSKPKPFGLFKMVLQKTGSLVVRFFSKTNVKDAASGFRAFSRTAMKTIVIQDKFSYTMETVFLAGVNNLKIANVPITINKTTRKSRLFKTVGEYIIRSSSAIIRIYLMYNPLKFFMTIGLIFLFLAFLLGLRYLHFMATGSGGGHVQSLILMIVLSVIGVQSVILGLVGDIVAANRKLLEEIRLRQIEKKNG